MSSNTQQVLLSLTFAGHLTQTKLSTELIRVPGHGNAGVALEVLLTTTSRLAIVQPRIGKAFRNAYVSGGCKEVLRVDAHFIVVFLPAIASGPEKCELDRSTLVPADRDISKFNSDFSRD